MIVPVRFCVRALMCMYFACASLRGLRVCTCRVCACFGGVRVPPRFIPFSYAVLVRFPSHAILKLLWIFVDGCCLAGPLESGGRQPCVGHTCCTILLSHVLRANRHSLFWTALLMIAVMASSSSKAVVDMVSCRRLGGATWRCWCSTPHPGRAWSLSAR